jgi:putative ABC transport system permease protein
MTGVAHRDTFRAPIGVRTRFPFRPAARLAWRLSFARLGRAALVVALIGVPITGLSAASVTIASRQATTADSLRATLGQSQSALQVYGIDAPGLRQSPTDWTTTSLGQGTPADYSSASDPATPTYADPMSAVPAGAASIAITTGSVVVQGPKVPVALTAVEGSTWSPSLDGHWRVQSGSAPTNEHEVMLTPATLQRLDAHIGDSLTLTSPRMQTFTVTGTIRDLNQTNTAQGIFLPAGSVPGMARGTASVTAAPSTIVYLPHRAMTWTEIQAANRHGIVVESRPVVLDPPKVKSFGPGSSLVWMQYALVAMIGLFALFEVCLLAAAAFLVGTRADTRTHAIASSVGGDRRFVFGVVAGSGVVLGAVGAFLGTAAGIGVGALAVHALDDGSVQDWPGLHLPWGVLAGVAAAGVIAGWAASIVAARSASRVDVVSALRGSRRPPMTRARRGRGLVGPLLVVVGAVLTVGAGAAVLALDDRPVQTDHWSLLAGAGVAIGPCLAQLGVILCTPAIMRFVARVGARLGLAVRMAVRDATRNPVRTVPVLASVMSVVFVATVVGSFVTASQARDAAEYQFRTAEHVATSSVQRSDGTLDPALTAKAASAMRKAMPGPDIRVLSTIEEQPQTDANGKVLPGAADVVLPHRFSTASCARSSIGPCVQYLISTDSSAPHIWVGTESDLAVLEGHAPSRAARNALAAGKAVSLWPEYEHDGAVQLDTYSAATASTIGDLSTAPRAARTTRVPAVLDVPDPSIEVGVFMTAATADHYGVPAVPSMLVTTMASAPSPQQSDEITSAWDATAGRDATEWGPYWLYENGPDRSLAVVMAFVLALAIVVTFAATGVAIGLARSDGRRDDEVLGTIGAPPRLRRAVSTWQAAVLTFVGAVVGVAFGLLPLRALTLRFAAAPTGTTHMAFVVDPWMLLLLAVGLPLVVTAGVWVTGGRRRRSQVVRTA